MKLFNKLLPWFMPRFSMFGITAAGIGAAAAVASAAGTIGSSVANSSSAKGANNKALRAQMEQNWRNQQLAQQMRDENFNQYDTAQRDAQGYITNAGQYAQNLNSRYVNQGGAAMDELSNEMGIGGYGSQAEADQANTKNEADYQAKLKAYNEGGTTGATTANADYQKQMADYTAQQKKVQDVKNWYNTFGASHGVSIAQAMQMGGITQDMMDAKAPAAMTADQLAAKRGAAPVRADKAVYNANGNRGELNKTYGMADYKNDPTYTPLVSNTLNQDEYSKTVGYTPMVNSLADLEATPGYKFQLEQGLKGLDTGAASRGMALSGAAMKSANNYAQGQAATGFQAAWERGQKAYGDAFSRKMQQYGQGQTAYNNARGNFQDQQQQKFNRLYGRVNANTDAYGMYTGSGQNFANNQGNAAYNNSRANQNMYSTIGNSLTDLGGQYLTYQNRGSSNNGTGTGLNGAQNNNGTGTFDWKNGNYNSLSKTY
jgi:hypothetical protein